MQAIGCDPKHSSVTARVLHLLIPLADMCPSRSHQSSYLWAAKSSHCIPLIGLQGFETTTIPCSFSMHRPHSKAPWFQCTKLLQQGGGNIPSILGNVLSMENSTLCTLHIPNSLKGASWVHQVLPVWKLYGAAKQETWANICMRQMEATKTCRSDLKLQGTHASEQSKLYIFYIF